ncbi:hypothetical protein V8G54_036122 [Vigna mungo]|uniref:Uncharacterized protein n=1 Tax=Vigna mungo TaxID=3915 RepID=A0AAQ3MH31_VIGMU
MEELQERAVEFIHIEDMRISQRKQQQEADVGVNRKDSKRSFGDNNKGGGSRPKDFPRTPKKLHSPQNAYGGKHCQYHQNLGHIVETERLTFRTVRSIHYHNNGQPGQNDFIDV